MEETIAEISAELQKNSLYAGLDNEGKEKVNKRVEDYAQQTAMADAFGDYDMATWIDNALAGAELGIDPWDYIAMLQVYGDVMTSDKTAAAVDYGMALEEYLKFDSELKEYGYGRDAEGNSKPDNKNISKNELIHVLDETEFTQDEKAYLFESRFPKAKVNPYK